ncbi:sodium/proline symporter PutP [Priestia taiwanensis]|uniref:Sodium/proline symporter n=1 Tax=Priestia taiwanensis TaxID=1347902 RepID=A0A917AUG8_9BACI|nr:sodium/proline symporter PutP [Priestia taiwanensis]MBM7364070.1 sodium/proline symporter [Priestia taiwanensis]GGE71378.1 sodium:proline symporter [Priestia taiwanensis]
MDTQLLFSIVIYMFGMLLIGYWAYRKTSNLSDYMLGGRSLGPAVTALSAGASDMSGWLLMGLPGAMYVTGLSSSWIAIGLVIGAYANWLFVAPRLRVYSEVASNAITIPQFLENRFKDTSHLLRLVSGLVIMIFFTFYVSSGLVSGAILFDNTFGIGYEKGLWIIAVVVVAYTLFGGFLAVSWTDFVQGLIMFLALIIVPVVTIWNVGGVEETTTIIYEVNPALFNLFEGTTFIGIISLLAWGLGYFGQPHIIVRFMAISSVKEMKKARAIGMAWMIFSIGGAMLTGFIGIAYFTGQGTPLVGAAAETVFIELSRLLFHPIISGFLLAAVLAAVMSTISSQLLVTSSAVTEDLYRTFFRRSASDKELVLVGRLAVLVVAVIAIGISYSKSETILALVAYAWAGFGASFGPVVLLSLYWKRMTKWGALTGMIAGASTVIIWKEVLGLSDFLYEMVPGFAVSTACIIFVSIVTNVNKASIEEDFTEVEKMLK